MAYVYPFVGTRYNGKVIENLADVLTPPYDCISPKLQDDLYQRHPKNFVRIILGKEVAGDDEFNNRYHRAGSLLQEWRREQTLIEDPKQSFYVCEQEYTNPVSGERQKRRGFFGLVRLQGYGEGKVRAHERTFKGPKADRFRLMRSTQFNLSPVFVLYDDPKNEIGDVLDSVMEKNKATAKVHDSEGNDHALWLASNKEALKRITDGMKERELLIADGHHRFETALHYRNEIRRMSGQKGGRIPADYLMMYLVSMQDPGLQILPTHRALADEAGVGVEIDEVLEDLKQHFKIEEFKVNPRKNAEEDAKMLLSKIGEDGQKTISMAMVLRGGRAFVLKLKRNVKPESLIENGDISPVVAKLDVAILHHHIIPNVWIGNPEIELDEGEVLYSRDAVETLKMLTDRRACVVFLMNSPKMEQVTAVSREGLRLPQKTTFFYPKIISGLVLRDMKTIGI